MLHDSRDWIESSLFCNCSEKSLSPVQKAVASSNSSRAGTLVRVGESASPSPPQTCLPEFKRHTSNISDLRKSSLSHTKSLLSTDNMPDTRLTYVCANEPINAITTETNVAIATTCVVQDHLQQHQNHQDSRWPSQVPSHQEEGFPSKMYA